MSDDIAIKVEHVGKSFKLPHDKQNSIKGGLISLFKNGRRTFETQEALKDISFEIKKGEFFGIVGRNGSGKSTLLKMLAGIYTPTKGTVTVNGSLTPFIELGVGFNPELTGRENIFLNGALLGFNRAEMSKMYKDIVEFAELERFMDQKLKNYSSGMQVRLAFSIAIRARSDILLLDEVLAVGDEAFQRKCYRYFGSLRKEKKTAVLVTHDMGAVERFCDRAILIEGGELAAESNSHDIAQLYSKQFSPSVSNETTNNLNNKHNNPQLKISAQLYQKGKQTSILESAVPFYVVVDIETKIDMGAAGCGINICNSQGQVINAFGTGDDGKQLILPKGHTSIEFNVDQNVLADDEYTLSLALETYDDYGESTRHYTNDNELAFAVSGEKVHRFALSHPRVSTKYDYRRS